LKSTENNIHNFLDCSSSMPKLPVLFSLPNYQSAHETSHELRNLTHEHDYNGELHLTTKE
ncbi:MAG: hypothetical protein ACK5IJ_07125, partial [Mangrovibacterium sp.]